MGILDPDRVLKEVTNLKKDRSNWENGQYLRGKNLNEFTEEMEKKYEFLSSNVSTLFKKCIDNDLDMNKLKEMLYYLKQIKKGKDQEEITKKVGESLANTYVKPIVDRLEKAKNKKEQETKNKIEEIEDE